MTTAQNIVDRINSFANDSANTIWTAAQKLESINAAIDASWPMVKSTKLDSSVTLAANTFEYSPTATDVNLQWGFSVPYITPHSTTSEPKVILKRIRQRKNGTAWTIIVPSDVASAFNGKLLYLQYHGALSRVTATTDTLPGELSLAYIFNYAMWFLSGSAMLRQAAFNTQAYRDQVAMWEKKASEELEQNHITTLPSLISNVADMNNGRYKDARLNSYVEL